MFSIGDIVIEDDIAYERFACNLSQCKGACCTLYGSRGAPIRDDELPELQCAYPFVRQYLSEQHLQIIETHGFVEGDLGSFTTVCIDNRACVFTYFEDDIARCSLEKALVEGKTKWRKPISCHLFPIRVTYGNNEQLRLERIAECDSARIFGTLKKEQLFDFVKDALIRKNGEEWYNKFRDICLYYNNNSNLL
ncbi:MAG: DUF3109 family protein [Bacteroidota bacterium]|nr:DUF3109 family protein [Bacteroidota bacterium]